LKDTEPRISAIIPTFQEHEYIADILSQLIRVKPPLEIIVVDGGSQDKTVEVARRFTNTVYNAGRRGISVGRNYGANKAKGNILLFLDTDVTLPADFPKKVLQAFRDPTVVGATCNIMPLHYQIGTTTFFRLYNLAIRATSKFKPHSRGEFFAVRKTAFQQAKGFNETMPSLEDHELAYRLAKIGKFVFIPDLTVYESMRRFRKLGFRKVLATWIIDFVFFMFRGKPLSPEWKPVR